MTYTNEVQKTKRIMEIIGMHDIQSRTPGLSSVFFSTTPGRAAFSYHKDRGLYKYEMSYISTSGSALKHNDKLQEHMEFPDDEVQLLIKQIISVTITSFKNNNDDSISVYMDENVMNVTCSTDSTFVGCKILTADNSVQYREFGYGSGNGIVPTISQHLKDLSEEEVFQMSTVKDLDQYYMIQKEVQQYENIHKELLQVWSPA